MTTVLPVMPDVIPLVRSVLNLNGLARVLSIDPQDTSTPWIRLVLAGGLSVLRQGSWAPRVDVNASAASPELASALARQAHAVLLGARNIWTPFGHLASCDESVGMQDLTDPTRTPPLHRQTFSVTAYLRP